MFHKDFYPTPFKLAVDLISPLHSKLKYNPSVLEPSAGKGDLLERMSQWRKENLYAIEISPELTAILVEKEYRVIGSDFLDFNEPYHFDAVIMNPPFSEGAKHFLKAWDVVADGGWVACILNAETIRNAHTEERKLVKRIIEAHNGTISYVADAFKEAERKTGVEVAVVHVQKPASKRFQFETTGLQFEASASEQEFNANPLATANMIEALVNQYNRAVHLMSERAKLESEMLFYTKGIYEPYIKGQKTLNEQIADMKSAFWDKIFAKTKLGSRVTSGFRKDFDKQTQTASNLAFTVANVMRVLEQFVMNSEQIMLDCICEVFEKATRFHEKNVVHTEGWKSNKSYKISRKLVVPRGVEYESRFGRFGGFSISNWGYTADFLKDVDRACCFASGKKFEDIVSIYTAIDNHINTNPRYDEKFESEFFEIRIFKKGTVHLEFRDIDIVNRLNILATKGMGLRVGGGY